MMSRGELEGDCLRRFGQKAVADARGASERTEYAIRAINMIGATSIGQYVVGARGKDTERQYRFCGAVRASCWSRTSGEIHRANNNHRHDVHVLRTFHAACRHDM
jgi:hypothetical protein